MIGGSRINIARIPPEALIRNAQVMELSRRSEAFGVVRDGAAVKVDMARVAARTAGVVEFTRRPSKRAGSVWSWDGGGSWRRRSSRSRRREARSG